ncbi:unnamed protein product [Acanthoscelides obtectus]|uniref:palmitoyl-protein hydrolase n=1 Tax=Acanthoscelides obtectus TaxID=200917 RepID=A0A9P0LTC0_ACAOB|nr:unnamed protein product [Acanthoscelides obtectus]CAK1634124.1 Lysophospholipase-like protein 1 [Acanthoscelides obtectus]
MRFECLMSSNIIRNVIWQAIPFFTGDTGQGFLNWVKFLMGSDFGLPHINFYFPTAPLRPYTPLGGSTSNVWFDRYNITPDVPEHIQTLEAIGQEMKGLIGKVADSGVPLNRIVIGTTSTYST